MARTPAQQMRRDLTILFGIPAVLLALLVLAGYRLLNSTASQYHLRPGEDLYETVAGVWDWNGETGKCDDPHQIAFDSAHRVMTITESSMWVDSSGVPRQVAVYDIEEVAGVIRGRIRGEERKTDAGVPVVWDLVLTSRDSYHWRRTDWKAGGTKEIERCADSLVSDSARARFAAPLRAEERFHAVERFAKTLAEPAGRVWGVTGDPDHFFVETLSDSGPRLHLARASDRAVVLLMRTTVIPGSDHFRLKSWHFGRRTVAIAEPMEEGTSRGILVYDVRNDSIVKHDLARVAYAGAGGPLPILDSLQVTELNGHLKIEVNGDLVVDPGDPAEMRFCRPLTFLPIELQETATGWRALNGNRKPACPK